VRRHCDDRGFALGIHVHLDGVKAIAGAALLDNGEVSVRIDDQPLSGLAEMRVIVGHIRRGRYCDYRYSEKCCAC